MSSDPPKLPDYPYQVGYPHMPFVVGMPVIMPNGVSVGQNPLAVPDYPGGKVGDSTEAQRNPLQVAQNPPPPIWDAPPRSLIWQTGGLTPEVFFTAIYQTTIFDFKPQWQGFAGQKWADSHSFWGSVTYINLQVLDLTGTKCKGLYLKTFEYAAVRTTDEVALYAPPTDATQDLYNGARTCILSFAPPGPRFYRIRLTFEIRDATVVTPPYLRIAGSIT